MMIQTQTSPIIEALESSETYGRFGIGPLDKGFGLTIGNCLRRVLLSSLQGAAITWVRIEGVQHEFSTLPRIKEDTIDFLLNVKAIRLRSLTNRPGRMVLEAEGEGVITAGSIKPSADFEIVNTDLHLATLDSKEAKLYVEFNVDIGKGYVQAGSSSGLAVGAIPVDAIFSPVRRVNYSVEPVRHGPETGNETLLLEIWTDGSVTPVQAVTQSAEITIEYFSLFKQLVEGPTKETGLSWSQRLTSEQYNTPIEQLNLSPRAYNSLKRGSVTTLGQIMEKGREGLLSLPGFGAKSQEEIEKILQGFGLSLNEEVKEKKAKDTSYSLEEAVQ